ncbi:MAG TPA: helix-turn-helix domain-containing protein [Actinophytocola sp.]|uniref:PucR family transcriptional regulator n=1 Tax=Actinophytocola sp. TaxID=1872138 RepID=UPI002DBD84C7|nr:helix-turn-helix domain-containing protein [Actinophytocola sp.]HEU5475166.1 helix-turn-helix domain-containing protein [Actinophytocola sp.]
MVTVEPAAGAVPIESAGLVAALRERLDAIAERWVSHIVAKNSAYLDNALVSLPDLRRTCRDNAESVLRLLAGDLTTEREPMAVVRASARRAAERGIPLDSLLRSYRLGGLALWQELAGCAAGRGEPELVDLAGALWLTVDEVSAEFATCYHYHRTELELLRMAEQRRRVMVDELLRGRGRDGGFAEEAALKLELPADSPYLVVTVEPTSSGRPGVEMPAETLAAGGFRSVWQVSGELLVGLVALERAGQDAALRRLRPAMRGRGGIGPVVSGLGQVDEAYQFASVAMATLPAGKPGLAILEDHLPEALLVRSPDLADMLVRELLGPVLDLPGKEGHYLLTTLAVWIDTNCSVAHTATRLYCHRNTVLNRLNRLESLLGRPLKGRATFVAVSLALTAWELGRGRGEGRPR